MLIAYSMSIGVFDSGIGGLNMLARLMECYPMDTYYYYCDNANLPYSNKDFFTILAGIESAIRYFEKQGVEFIILACNTASVLSDGWLKNDIPVVRLMPHIDTGSRCLLMATPPTINMLNKRGKLTNVQVANTPELAQLVEEYIDEPRTLKPYLAGVLSKYLVYDKILLGCSHYIYLEKEIKELTDAKIDDGVDRVLMKLALLRSFESPHTKSDLKFCFSGVKEEEKYRKILANLLK